MTDTADDMDRPITKREALDIFLTKGEFRHAVENDLVTKREFHEVLANLFAHIDRRFDAIDKRFASLMTWLETDFKNALKTELRTELRTDLSSELRSHSGANADQLQREVGLVDDRYKDLPERVTKLEAAVFPAPPAKRQRRR